MKLTFYLLPLFIIFILFTRFYNVSWGAPYYFHPDERNIASSITQMSYPSQLNPHFFAYGSLPIYTIYFSAVAWNLVNHHTSSQVVSFDEAIIISRLYSAIFSLLIIPILYLIGKKFWNFKTGRLAAFFAATSTGFIQFAHFGTFEMWTTFFITSLLLLTFQTIKQPSWKNAILSGILLGILCSIKISNCIFISIPVVALLLSFQNLHLKKFFTTFFKVASVYTLALCIIILTNPYSLTAKTDFLSSMNYETGVALGTIPVFYTQEFYGKLPFLYQFMHIYPFILNPFMTILLLISIAFFIAFIFRTKNHYILILLIFYLITFLSQAFLFTKWTRYMIPTLPFIYLLISTMLSYLQRQSIIWRASYGFLYFICILFSASYFISTFVEIDTRVAAAIWTKHHAPPTKQIGSEVYDLGITAFNPYFPNIHLYNFYELDSSAYSTASQDIMINDMIILPSQRIIKTRLDNAKTFPVGNKFYQDLLSGKKNFVEIYQTPCDLFCQITYLGNPVNSFEETASVFDRPVIFIFAKNAMK